jgi:hypothetical protein
VVTPGGVTLSQGSALNQSINLVGSTRLLKGKVELIRFTREGEMNWHIFSYRPNAASTSYDNPILMAGDIVRVYGLYSTGRADEAIRCQLRLRLLESQELREVL